MKIQNHDIGMEAKHQYQEKISVKESTSRIRLENATQEQRDQVPEEAVTLLSQAGLARQAAERSRIPVAKTSIQSTDNLDPKIQMLKSVVEALTGKKIDLGNPGPVNIAVSSASAQPAEAPAVALNFVSVESTVEYSESESLSFSAFGSITTEDGKTFGFTLDFSMERSFSFSSSTSSFRIESANLKDPLVLNFGGTSAELRENSKVSFDLDNDGTMDEFSFVGPGSGFLALDTHSDGSVKDGSQLFGTASGNGFADLAKFDSDGNAWIDENDAIYAKLMIWTMDEEGNQVTKSLKEANVGAIYLGNVNTQYSLKDGSNSTLGELRNTGVFLTEDGKAKTIQHVDIAI